MGRITMRRSQTLVIAFLLVAGCQPDTGMPPEAETKEGQVSARVLIVTDESDRMEPLAAFLEDKAGIRSTIIDYAVLPESERRLPEGLSHYDALVGYIHNELNEATELAIIDYTENGGRFVAVHHMISSGKARNRYYFDFLGVAMDGIEQAREPAEPGGHYIGASRSRRRCSISPRTTTSRATTSRGSSTLRSWLTTRRTWKWRCAPRSLCSGPRSMRT